MDNRNDNNISEPQFISFQDYPSAGQSPSNYTNLNHQNVGNLSNDPTGIGILEDLQGMPVTNEGEKLHSFWTIEYYQKYFNISTNDVLERIKRSIYFQKSENFLTSHIRPNPDLYGPFWICATLVFSIAISGNLANYYQTPNSVKAHWRYDFHLVSIAATCIFLYAWLLPIILWSVIKWTNGTRNTDEDLIIESTTPGVLELLCLYGYSLSIYIPVAFLWTIQIEWLQWSLLIIATLISGGVLLHSLLPIIAGTRRIIFITTIFGMHVLLAAGFKLYFFHTTINNESENLTMKPTVITEAAIKIINQKLSNLTET